jgi:hypothetical protein
VATEKYEKTKKIKPPISRREEQEVTAPVSCLPPESGWWKKHAVFQAAALN